MRIERVAQCSLRIFDVAVADHPATPLTLCRLRCHLRSNFVVVAPPLCALLIRLRLTHGVGAGFAIGDAPPKFKQIAIVALAFRHGAVVFVGRCCQVVSLLCAHVAVYARVARVGVTGCAW